MTQKLLFLREPLEAVLRQFTYEDLGVRASEGSFRQDWTISAAVAIDGGTVGVFASERLALMAADGFLGVPSDAAQRIDVVGELANVLAGQVYEIRCCGRRPSSIDTPALLSPDTARAVWNAASPHGTFECLGESGIVGGLLVSFSDEWNSAWA